MAIGEGQKGRRRRRERRGAKRRIGERRDGSTPSPKSTSEARLMGRRWRPMCPRSDEQTQTQSLYCEHNINQVVIIMVASLNSSLLPSFLYLLADGTCA